MNTLSRSMLGLVGGLLVAFALGTLGFLSALASPQAADRILKQEPVGFGDGIVEMGNMPNGFQRPKELVIQWVKPTAPAPSWLDHKEDVNEIEERIRAVLNERMEVDFNALSLSTIVKILRGKFDIPIFIDVKALEEENISEDQPITLERPPTKLCDILTQILRPLQLTYVVELEAITITTRRSSANKTKCYDLSFILPDNSLISELLGSIETMVKSHEWQSVGGNSSMTTVGSMLMINAPDDTHLELASLLRAISKQSPANLKPRVFLDAAINKPAEGEKTSEKH